MLVIFVGAGIAVYQVADLGQKAAARDAGTDVTNESHIQQVGVWQLTSNSTNQFTAGFDDEITVWNNSTPRSKLVEGEDYEWNKSDGALFLKNSPNTTDGQQYLISYTFYTNTDEVQDVAGPLDVLTRGVGNIGYLGAGIALVVFLLGFAWVVSNAISNRSGPRSNR